MKQGTSTEKKPQWLGSFLEELKEHVSEHMGNELADSRRTLLELRDRAEKCEVAVKELVDSTEEKKAES